MFVAFNDNKEETNRYVKSVTYHLHPTFKPSKIKVSEAPFLLSRLGWGYFTVEFDVEFHEWTKLGTVRMEHELSFDNKGHTQSMLLDVDMSDEGKVDSQNVIQELSKGLKKLNVEEKKE